MEYDYVRGDHPWSGAGGWSNGDQNFLRNFSAKERSLLALSNTRRSPTKIWS